MIFLDRLSSSEKERTCLEVVALAAWRFAQAGGTRGKAAGPAIRSPCFVLAAGNERRAHGFACQERTDASDEGETTGDADAARMGGLRAAGEVGAIRECEEHGWMRDRADPHARERAFDIGSLDPPSGISPEEARAVIAGVLDSIGDTCPQCPPE